MDGWRIFSSNLNLGVTFILFATIIIDTCQNHIDCPTIEQHNHLLKDHQLWFLCVGLCMHVAKGNRIVLVQTKKYLG